MFGAADVGVPGASCDNAGVIGVDGIVGGAGGFFGVMILAGNA